MKRQKLDPISQEDQIAEAVNSRIVNRGSQTETLSVRLFIRMTQSDFNALKNYADSQNRKVSDAARVILTQFLKANQEEEPSE